MTTVSTARAFLLALVLLTVTFTAVRAADWPIKRQIDLSSGFGDYRDNRFHAGVDLRTASRVGERVYAPVDGYLYRVKMSYKGYGKGLYMKGDDGHIYVFGHISQFSGRLRPLVEREQLKARRYYIDHHFPTDSVRIAKGELIAYSGKTGVGAPHLHFEMRTPDNRPVNPLTHDYEIADSTRPVFSRIGFKLIDDNSLFENGERRLFLDVAAGKEVGQYVLDTVLYFNRPFGLLADCYDKMRPGGMSQTIYKLSLYIDGDEYYEVVFDMLDFETSTTVGLEYDYLNVVSGHKRVRRLFHRTGNDYIGSRAVRGSDGTYGTGGREKPGLHKAKIVAEDCFGNKAELKFSFLWGADENLYSLDSTATGPGKQTRFYFSPSELVEAIDIDSVRLYVCRGDRWGPVQDAEISDPEKGRIECMVPVRNSTGMILSLYTYTGQGALIKDGIFSQQMPRGKANALISHEVVDDGLMLTLETRARKGSYACVALWDGDQLLGFEYPQIITMWEYRCFIPVKPEYSRITRISYSMTADTSHTLGWIDSLNIQVVGLEDNQVIEIEDYGSIRFDRDHFFEPRYIEFKRNRIVFKGRLRLNSDHFEVLPEAFVCRREFDISINLPDYNAHNDKSGICWLDKEADKWVWLDNVNKDGVLTAKSIGGGSFAVLYDYDPPDISKLNIINGRTYYDLKPVISFNVADSLSGIVDDLAFTIKLDGQWMIPEYDPEDKVCKTVPVEALEPGSHHLGIMVTDRLGNLTEQYLNFNVSPGNRKRPGKGN